MKPRHLIPALFFALLIAYPLPIGPMAKWYNRHYPRGTIGPRWPQVFYAPLFWAVEHSVAVDKAFGWYIRLWRVEDPSPE